MAEQINELASATSTLASSDELDWRTCGIVELAVRNVNVASYIDHWETRAIGAEHKVADALAVCRHYAASVGDRCGVFQALAKALAGEADLPDWLRRLR